MRPSSRAAMGKSPCHRHAMPTCSHPNAVAALPWLVKSEPFRALVSHYLFEPSFARPGEGHDKGMSTEEAVRHGISSTAGTVTTTEAPARRIKPEARAHLYVRGRRFNAAVRYRSIHPAWFGVLRKMSFMPLACANVRS